MRFVSYRHGTLLPTGVLCDADVYELNPGGFVTSGTPQGISATRNPPIWRKPGGVAQVEINQVGRLCKGVV